jgi:hypothetical protein
MIVITGPGRSGTSVLAQFCLKMGHDPGGSWHDCVDAGMEHPRVAAINDALFLEVMRTGTVQKTLDAHREEMRSLDLVVVKDPRFSFHPAILRAWHSVRSDLKVLMTYRTPEHSIASRKRHARDLVHKHKAHPDVLRCDFANGIETMLDLELPFAILLFPNFLTQYQHVYAAFDMLGMPFDHAEGQEVWNTLVNMEKVHFRPATAQQGEGAITAKPRREAGGNPRTRLPLMTASTRPSIALALLVCLICAPIGWRALSAASVPTDPGLQAQRGAMRRLGTSPFLYPHHVRHWTGSAPFNAAFLRGLAAYSIHRLPFETWNPGRTLHHRGLSHRGVRQGRMKA